MRAELLLLAALSAAALPATAQETNQPKPPAVQIPVSIGQSVKGIRFPHFEGTDKLSMRFNAESAERTSETTFHFQGLRIEVFDDSPDKPAMQVLLKNAVFDRDTGLLTSKETAKITGETFEIVGQSLEFDSKTRSSKLLGPVAMTVTQIEENVSP